MAKSKKKDPVENPNNENTDNISENVTDNNVSSDDGASTTNNTSTVATTVDTINNNVIDDKFSSIMKEIDAFSEYDFQKIDEVSEWEEVFELYNKIAKEILEYGQDKTIPKPNLNNNLEELYGDLSAIKDSMSLSMSKWNLKYSKAMEERVAKSQTMNFTVFSIFMTLLTFLLTNIVVGIQTVFNIKKMVITNLTLLLIASVLFLFIGFFMGLIGVGDKRSIKILKMTLLFSMPFFIGVCLILSILFL